MYILSISGIQQQIWDVALHWNLAAVAEAFLQVEDRQELWFPYLVCNLKLTKHFLLLP